MLRTISKERVFPNWPKWGTLTPDEASSLVEKESVDDAYHLHGTGTGPTPIISPSRSPSAGPTYAGVTYQRPQARRNLAFTGLVPLGRAASASALPTTIAQRSRWPSPYLC